MVFHASYKKGCKRKTVFLFATFFHYCQIPALLFNYIKQPSFTISVNIGFTPLTKHSTAITIKMSPIRRIITLLPVSPNKLTKRVEALQYQECKKINKGNSAYKHPFHLKGMCILHQYDCIGNSARTT